MAQTPRQLRLHVLAPEPRRQVQDCGICRNQPNCWKPKIKEEHIITNLLVCRIKRGIDVNRSSRLFLEMVRPKLKKIAKHMIGGTHHDMSTALSDLEAQTIYLIKDRYIMGEIAYPLHWLFGKPNGQIRRWANTEAGKLRKYENTTVVESAFRTSPIANRSAEDEGYNPYEADPGETALTKAARAIVDDGVTLSLQEYRVLKFCLENASEAKRPLNGLHVYLARRMGIVRARITRVCRDATEKMKKEVLVTTRRA